jgi:hypothetical protein
MARAAFTGCLVMAGGLCFPGTAGAITPGPTTAVVKSVDDPASLDAKRLYALGMIETGNDDRAVGAAGEVSRYQLSPPVWKSYSKSVEYQNPGIALQVARLHWAYLAAYFKEKNGHMPDDYDMYVMWNTRFGYYAHKGFSKRTISPVVQDRAQRFVNLVRRKD